MIFVRRRFKFSFGKKQFPRSCRNPRAKKRSYGLEKKCKKKKLVEGGHEERGGVGAGG